MITAQIKSTGYGQRTDGYFDNLTEVEYEKFEGRTDVGFVGNFESLDDLYEKCDYDKLVIGQPNKYDMNDVDYAVTVYDGYIE